MKNLKISFLILLLSSTLACAPLRAQENAIESNSELPLKKQELGIRIKEVCEHPLIFPRTYYLTSKNKIFSEYARNFERQLDAKLRKSDFAQAGFLIFAVRIASTGSLNSVEVIRFEGSDEMNELVKRLIHSGAPYAKFSQKMASVADEIFFVSTVKSKNFRIPPTSVPVASDDEINALKERLDELTKLNHKMYERLCGSSN